jgi:hypothetical protein
MQRNQKGRNFGAEEGEEGFCAVDAPVTKDSLPKGFLLHQVWKVLNLLSLLVQKYKY